MITDNIVTTARNLSAVNAAIPSMAKATDRASKAFAIPRSTTLPMLSALQRKHVYAGTVPAVEVARRRASNRAARRQRRVNNLRNFRKGVR